MKKFFLVLVMAAFSVTPCFASDGGDLTKAQKAAESMMAVFSGKQQVAYKTLSANFSQDLKKKLGEKELAELKKQVKEKFGQMNESKFVAFERFDKADRLTYFTNFTKEKVVAVSFGVDKKARILEFRLAPVKPQPKPAEATEPEKQAQAAGSSSEKTN